MDYWIADLTTEVLLAPSLASARDGFRRLAARAGVENYAYANFDGSGSLSYLDTTYCKDWVEHYIACRYLAIDPVVAEGARRQLPFAWRFVMHRPDLTAPQRALFQEAAGFGICDGLTIPFHGKRGYSGLASLVFSSAARLRETLHAQPNLRLLAFHYHSAVERLLEEKDEGPGLTNFERQCLSWAASGRSLWDISAVTNRPEADIAAALRTVRRKLGAESTSQAAAKAIGQGLIAISAKPKAII